MRAIIYLAHHPDDRPLIEGLLHAPLRASVRYYEGNPDPKTGQITDRGTLPKLAAAIGSSDAVLVLWTAAAAKDAWLRAEVALAARAGLPLLLIRAGRNAPDAPLGQRSVALSEGVTAVARAVHEAIHAQFASTHRTYRAELFDGLLDLPANRDAAYAHTWFASDEHTIAHLRAEASTNPAAQPATKRSPAVTSDARAASPVRDFIDEVTAPPALPWALPRDTEPVAPVAVRRTQSSPEFRRRQRLPLHMAAILNTAH